MNNFNINVSDPISPLWNIIDNRIVRWLNRKAEWILPTVAAAAYMTGYTTFSKAAVLVLAGKVISTAIHFFNNYAEVSRIQSTFRTADIRDLKAKVEDQTATDDEKYRLADLLYQRALEYDFEGPFIATPGHGGNSILSLFQFYIQPFFMSGTYAYLIAKVIKQKVPDDAINNDLKDAYTLYKEVVDSTDPHINEALKANTLYKFAYMSALGFSNYVLVQANAIQESKQKFDLLTDQGLYADQMEKLSKVVHLCILQHMSWHHPREIFENIENFGVTINKFSDICPTCSLNHQKSDAYQPPIVDEI